MSNIKADSLADKIRELKKSRNAVIVAHNYQLGEVQDIADCVGDSLAMARYGVQSEASTVVICGVHFMAESAAILSPQKKRLIPVQPCSHVGLVRIYHQLNDTTSELQ